MSHIIHLSYKMHLLLPLQNTDFSELLSLQMLINCCLRYQLTWYTHIVITEGDFFTQHTEGDQIFLPCCNSFFVLPINGISSALVCSSM